MLREKEISKQGKYEIELLDGLIPQYHVFVK